MTTSGHPIVDGTVTQPEPPPADVRRWRRSLSTLHASALDCMQTSLALLAEDAFGPGTHLNLGAMWRLQTDEHRELTFVRRSLQDRLDDAASLVGLRVMACWSDADGPMIRMLLAERGPLYVVGEAFDMPWLPYAGRRLMAHSHLVDLDDDRYTIIDAYHNDTPYGPARPGVWRLKADQLDRVLARTAIVVALRPDRSHVRSDLDVVIDDNRQRARTAQAEIDQYVDALRAQSHVAGAAERLTLDIWLLGRERRLYADWLHALGLYPITAAAADERADAWRRLATASYVALRRHQRGVDLPASLVDDLGEQLRLDAELTAAGPQ